MSKAKSIVGNNNQKKKIVKSRTVETTESDNQFTIAITSNPSCLIFHRTSFNKPTNLYKINNLFKDIDINETKVNIPYLSLCRVSSTRIRGKYYLPSSVKIKVTTMTFNKNLLNIGAELSAYCGSFIDYSTVHIDQSKLSLYGRRRSNIVIAICDQTLLITRRLGNLLFVANTMGDYVILAIMSSNIIDELVSEKIIKTIDSKLQDNWKNKIMIIEVSKKPIDAQKRLVMNAIMQFSTFFELNYEQTEKYYQKIKNKK